MRLSWSLARGHSWLAGEALLPGISWHTPTTLQGLHMRASLGKETHLLETRPRKERKPEGLATMMSFVTEERERRCESVKTEPFVSWVASRKPSTKHALALRLTICMARATQRDLSGHSGGGQVLPCPLAALCQAVVSALSQVPKHRKEHVLLRLSAQKRKGNTINATRLSSEAPKTLHLESFLAEGPTWRPQLPMKTVAPGLRFRQRALTMYAGFRVKQRISDRPSLRDTAFSSATCLRLDASEYRPSNGVIKSPSSRRPNKCTPFLASVEDCIISFHR
ncbi:hypothetical protein H920_08297 [Fukomys damarensis]|uniref:Uncharacterized protein n=1 Tax=Fukomys damarensis TaxID=885580 RepID=A0A091E5B7_FUKDA|nr:hypothetical protein H920_08297 [Fukomys damarensis]